MAFEQITTALLRATTTVQHTESPIEGMLLSAIMRNNAFTLAPDGDFTGEGLFVIPQKEFGPYRADFYVVAQGYYNGARLWPPRIQRHFVVECDGQEFHSTPEQVEHDRRRDRYCAANRISVIRLAGSMIYKHPDLCAENVAREIKASIQGAK